LHILCLTNLLTAGPLAFQEMAVGAHTVLAVLYHCNGKMWTFLNLSKQLRQESIKVYTTGWTAQEKMLSRCVSLFSTTTKNRFGKKKNMLWMQHPQQMAIKEDSN